jgi:MtN3 and saliva related transmembrane protein
MDRWVANSVGTVAALCTIVSFVPQIVKIARERDASSVSLRMYLFTVTSFTLWTVYGVLLMAWPLILANAASLACAVTALFLKWRYRDGPRSAEPER